MAEWPRTREGCGLIIWRSNDQEWRRYVDYFFIALVVILLVIGVYGVLNWSDEGKVVETIPNLPAGLIPLETTTTQRTVPPEYTLPERTSTSAPPTTKPAATTVAPTTVVSTTVPRTTTVTTVAPVVTTVPPPPDTSGPSIGALSPNSVFEAPCTPSVKFTVTISDPAGVAEAKMFGKAMSRRVGTNTWELTTSIGDVTSDAQESISFAVPISAKDTLGNSRSKTASITVKNC